MQKPLWFWNKFSDFHKIAQQAVVFPNLHRKYVYENIFNKVITKLFSTHLRITSSEINSSQMRRLSDCIAKIWACGGNKIDDAIWNTSLSENVKDTPAWLDAGATWLP